MGKIWSNITKAIPGVGQYMAIAEPLLNAASQYSTNKVNKDIAQMNNEFNERMMDKQFQNDVRLMEMQNDYNDPLQQVQRLRQAGLNPAFALGQVASGSATSARPIGTGMPSAQQVNMQAPQFSGLTDAMRYLLERKQVDANVAKTNSETRANNLNFQFLVARNLAELNEITQRGRGLKFDNKMKAIKSSMYRDMLGADYENKKLQNLDLQQSTQMKHFQTLMLEKQFNVFDTEFKMRMADVVSQIELRMAQKQLTENQAKHELEKWLETQEKTNGLKISNDTNRRMADYIVEKARKDSYHSNPISAGDELIDKVIGPGIQGFFNLF